MTNSTGTTAPAADNVATWTDRQLENAAESYAQGVAFGWGADQLDKLHEVALEMNARRVAAPDYASLALSTLLTMLKGTEAVLARVAANTRCSAAHAARQTSFWTNDRDALRAELARRWASAEEEAYAENADRTLFARLEELARIKIESARARERAVTGDEMHDAQAAWTKARNEQRATFAAMDSATYSRWLAR